MNAKDKEFYDIVFKNCTEEEIYAILLKKKEIDDKIPKLRTEDETRTLRSLYNKMRKFPKDLIAEMKNKFPSLQRKPKTSWAKLYGPAPEGLCNNFLISCLLSVCNIFTTPTAAYHTPKLERAHKAWPNLFVFDFSN